MNDVTILDRSDYLEQLKSIHGLRDQLGLSSEGYRELLHRLTGLRSAKVMTPEQRQQVITFMRVHKALDDALEQLEAARDALNESYPRRVAPLLEKLITVDGRREASMTASVEEIIEVMRQEHGAELRLVGARERRLGHKTVLELAFEHPAVLAMAS